MSCMYLFHVSCFVLINVNNDDDDGDDDDISNVSCHICSRRTVKFSDGKMCICISITR